MPRRSAILSLPAALYNICSPGEPTGHKSTVPNKRRADKAAQRDLRVAQAGIALKTLPADGAPKVNVHNQSLTQWAGSLGYKCPQSACRLLGRKGRGVIRITRKKQHIEAKWNLAEVARPNYHPACFQPGSAADLAAMPEHAALFKPPPTIDGATGQVIETKAELSNLKYRKFMAVAHHPLSILHGTDLAVYDYLVAHDLYVCNKATKQWKAGKIQQTQEQIAAALKCDRNAVARSLRRLAVSWTDRAGVAHPGLGLILFIGKPGAWYWVKTGAPLGKGTKPTPEQRRAGLVQWRQDEPNEYIGVCEWVPTELESFERAMEPVWATQANWATHMNRIFRQTLGEWQEPENDSAKFRAECARRMIDAGIPEWQVEVVFPHSHGPP
jgi:hypothetical protein